MAQWVLNAESADIQHMRLAVTGQQCALLCAICVSFYYILFHYYVRTYSGLAALGSAIDLEAAGSGMLAVISMHSPHCNHVYVAVRPVFHLCHQTKFHSKATYNKSIELDFTYILH